MKTHYHCYGELQPGDQGTIVDITTLPKQLGGNRQIWIRWDRQDGKTTVALIEGEDRFIILD